MSNQVDKPSDSPAVDTGSSTYVEAGVSTGGGDFIGHHQINNTVNNFIQQALSAVEEAERAEAL